MIQAYSHGVYAIGKDFTGYNTALRSNACRTHATNILTLLRRPNNLRMNFVFLTFLFLLEICYSNIMVWISLISIKISSFIAKGHMIAIFFTPTFLDFLL